MNAEERQSLIQDCLRYARAMQLPTPLPTSIAQYDDWEKLAAAPKNIDDDAENAWFELYRLAAEEPDVAWEVLIELTAHCRSQDECAPIAAGPLSTFLRKYQKTFASKIDDEKKRNVALRLACDWLQESGM